MQSNIRDKVVFASPKNEDEREYIAGLCVHKLGIEFPAVLDEFGNSTERAYTGWPDRMYLIDASGRVAFKSKPGPFGFEPDQLRTALAKVASKQQSGSSVPATQVPSPKKEIPDDIFSLVHRSCKKVPLQTGPDESHFATLRKVKNSAAWGCS
jgi:hypothetical protein